MSKNKNKSKKSKPNKKLKKLMEENTVFTAVLPEDKALVTEGFDSTIADTHYTPLSEHPEDRIYRDREYIHRLQKHIDEIYAALESDLNLKEENNWLFDYIYNEDDNIEFEEYLNKYKVQYKDIVNEDSKISN
jgi:hypothetical protein